MIASRFNNYGAWFLVSPYGFDRGTVGHVVETQQAPSHQQCDRYPATYRISGIDILERFRWNQFWQSTHKIGHVLALLFSAQVLQGYKTFLSCLDLCSFLVAPSFYSSSLPPLSSVSFQLFLFGQLFICLLRFDILWTNTQYGHSPGFVLKEVFWCIASLAAAVNVVPRL